MGADAHSTSLVCRRAAEITTNIDIKEIQFDKEISGSTIQDAVTKEIIESNNNLSNDEKLQKLKEIGSHTPILPSEIGTDFNFKRKIVWFNATGFILLHICALIGVFFSIFGYAKFATTVYALWLVYASGQGITMGAHRLWAHRAFKANVWLKVFLLWLHTLAGQNCLWIWVRDHRQHHKYSDTDADPHNANRGFFFSHVGWLMSRKHPKVKEYGYKIDMSDMDADPWIMFQKNHYKVLYTIFALMLPTMLPIFAWGETPVMAFFVAFFARTIINLNATWLVNSAAHLYGTRPYDKTMLPVESMFISFLAVGEGWHNYHHAFPWDYRASELGTPLNLTGFFIDLLANIGLIWDRKEATHNMVKNRVMRTGDGSHRVYGTPMARKAFKTLFNLWKHPLNPTYMSLYMPRPKTVKSDGYALTSSELPKSELDDAILAKENEDLVQRQKNEEALNSSFNLAKYIVEKGKLDGENYDLSSTELPSFMNNNIKQIEPVVKSTLNVLSNDSNLRPRFVTTCLK